MNMLRRIISSVMIALLSFGPTTGVLADQVSAQTVSSTVCLSGCDFVSIQAAVNAATAGDTIIVAAGTIYTEDVTINTPGVSLLGDPGATTKSGPGSSAPSIIGAVTIKAANVTVTGFDISNPTGFYAIAVGDPVGGGIAPDNAVVSYNRAHDVHGTASGSGIRVITVEPSANVAIKSNIVEDSSPTNSAALSYGITVAGIWLRSAGGAFSNASVEDNVVRNISQPNATGNNGVNGIWVGGSGQTFALSGLSVQRNQITNISSNLVAYGFHINHGNGTALTTTGLVAADNIINNISSSGAYVHAIGLEKRTTNAQVTGNIISSLTSTSPDVESVGFIGNPDASTVTLSGTTFNGHPVSNSNASVIVNPAYVSLSSAGNTFPEVLSGNTYYYYGLSAFSTIQASISAAATGGTINLATGTYTEAGQIVISKNLSVVGAGIDTTTIMTSSDTGNTNDSKGWFLVNPGMTFNLSNATLDGVGHKIYQAIRYNGSGTINHVSFTNIAYEQSGPQYNGAGVRIGSSGNVDITNSTFSHIGRVGVIAEGGTGTFSGNIYTGKGAGDWLDYALDIEFGSHITISNNQISHNRGVASVDGSTSAAIAVWDDPGTLTAVNGNTLTDNTAGVAVAVASGSADPVVTIGLGNTFTDNAIGVDIQNAGATGSPAVSITGSIFSGNTTDINVPSGMSASNISVHGSTFSPNTNQAIDHEGSDTLNATNNYWGSAVPDFSSIILGSNVNHDPWYTDPAKTILSNNTLTDATYSSITDGQADLPSGVTTIVLDDTHNLDVSNGVNNASGGNIVIGGVSQDLSNYTGGNLGAGVNLDAPQTIGGQSVTIGAAVTLQSGTNTQPIVLTNTGLSHVSASIPDGTTVLAPNGWDGKISPPKVGTSSGTAPSGFSVGNTVIEIGSPGNILIFDKAVTVLLTGVTGSVGYRPAGSTVWAQITNTCGGTYASPADPAFPGECSISDGTDTKILTYHFTTFAALTATPAAPTPTPTPTPAPSATPSASTGTPAAGSRANTASDTVATTATPAASEGQVAATESNRDTSSAQTESPKPDAIPATSWFKWYWLLLGAVILGMVYYTVDKRIRK